MSTTMRKYVVKIFTENNRRIFFASLRSHGLNFLRKQILNMMHKGQRGVIRRGKVLHLVTK